MPAIPSSMLWSDVGLQLRVEGPEMQPGGTHFEMPHPFVRVGRIEGADLQLSDPKISRWHAYFHRLPDGIFFIDLGSRTGIEHCGQRVAHGWVHPQEPIILGRYKLFVETGQPDPGYDPLMRLPRNEDCLLPVALSLTNRRAYTIVRPLTRVLTLLGSDKPSNLQITGASIFRAHVVFYRTEQQLWAMNLIGSHVFRANRRLIAASLHDGDVCVVGDLVVTVRRGGHDHDDEGDEPGFQSDDAGVHHANAVDAEDGIDAAMDSELEVKALQTEFDSTEQENAEHASHQELVEEIRRLSADAGAMEQLLHELESSKQEQVQALREELDRAGADLDAAKAENEHLSRRLQKHLRDHRELKKSQQQVGALEHSLQQLTNAQEGQNREFEAERSRLERELAIQRARSDDLARQLDSLQKERDELKETHEQTQMQLGQQREQSAAQLARLQEEMHLASQAAAAQLNSLGSERDALEVRCQQMIAEQARTIDEIHQLKDDRQRLHEQIEQERARYQQALIDLESTTAQARSLQKDYYHSSERAGRVEEELKAVGARLAEATAKIEKQAADVERTLIQRDAALSDLAESRDGLAKVRADLDQSRSENARLAASEAQFAGRLAEKDQALERERTQFERLRHQLETKSESTASENRQLHASLATVERDLEAQAREIVRLKGVLAKIAPRSARASAADSEPFDSRTTEMPTHAESPTGMNRPVAPTTVANVPDSQTDAVRSLSLAAVRSEGRAPARNIGPRDVRQLPGEVRERTLNRPKPNEFDRRPHLEISEQLLNRAGRIERTRKWIRTALWIGVAIALIGSIALFWTQLQSVSINIFAS